MFSSDEFVEWITTLETSDVKQTARRWREQDAKQGIWHETRDTVLFMKQIFVCMRHLDRGQASLEDVVPHLAATTERLTNVQMKTSRKNVLRFGIAEGNTRLVGRVRRRIGEENGSKWGVLAHGLHFRQNCF